MTFSLITMILLYLSLTRQKVGWWLAYALFTVLNLYTHYGALVVLAWPLLQQEHAYAEGDWKALTEYLGARAREGDTFVSMALDLPNGYNQGAVVWPYYLDQTFEQYTFLASNRLQSHDVESLANASGSLWLALLSRVVPVEFQAGTADSTAFQNGLYLVQPAEGSDSDLETLITMYEQMIPLAVAPSPQCLLRHDLATMLAVAGSYDQAERLVVEATTQCPEGMIDEPNRYLLLARIYRGLEDEYQAQEEPLKVQQAEKKSRQVAAELFRLGIREPAALASVAVHDLLQIYQSGSAQVALGTAPEPVQVRRSSMPQDGDWSDVLFVHAGASVSFPVTLPAEPAALSFRAAMNPDSWDWGGDGSTFIVLVQTGDGEPVEVYRCHVSNEEADRRWHEELVPLVAYAGQVITITLQSEPGRALDYTGDWAGWGQPLIVLEPQVGRDLTPLRRWRIMGPI